jgi:methylated-DNA-[protein]-cysteine S-methyltransferase
MNTPCFALFDTAVGRCAIAWTGRGIAGVRLPGRRDAETRAGLLRDHPGARELPPPPPVRSAINAIVALLNGNGGDLSGVRLDLAGVPPFHRRVYRCARAIPAGTTLSYGELARRLRSPGAARAVGQALARNPFPVIVPCHRVLAAGGRIGGFSAPGGAATKRRLLAAEGGCAA